MRRAIWAASCLAALVVGWVAGRSQETERVPIPGKRSLQRPAPTQEPPPVSVPHGHSNLANTLEGRSPDLPSRAPIPVTSLLEEFRHENLAALVEALIEIQDPSVLPAMLAFATDPVCDRERRLAALAVIDGRNEREALGPVAELIRTERDPELLRAAIHALPEGQAVGMSEVQPASAALRNVLHLPTETHQNSKEAALILLSRWSLADRPSILAVLRNDPSPRIRAAAAFGLIYAPAADADTLRALAEAVGNPREEPAVRANAWRALGAAGVLPDDVIAAYQSFRP